MTRPLTSTERIHLRHLLQELAETSRSVRNAMDPLHGMHTVTDDAWLDQWQSLTRDLDIFTSGIWSLNARSVQMAWRRLGQDYVAGLISTEQKNDQRSRLLALASSLPESEQQKLTAPVREALSEVRW